MTAPAQDGHFSALLRFWRHARGLSQLDLATSAGISSRHLSVLETGRATPSREMVLKLAAPLSLSLVEQNELLRSAGFALGFIRTTPGELSPHVRSALDWMKEKQEPYPLVVLDRHYQLVESNRAAQLLVGVLLGGRPLTEENTLKWLFDPDLLRPLVNDWSQLAQAMLLRVQREQLMSRRDHQLSTLLSELLAYPDVPHEWSAPDWSASSPAALPLSLNVRGQTVRFVTALTVFQAPRDIGLEDLRIESYFPIDQATQEFCEALMERGAC